MKSRLDTLRHTAALTLRAAVFAMLVGSFALPSASGKQNVRQVPGVDIIVKKNPGGSKRVAQSGKDGSYRFTGLEPGSYEVQIAGRAPQTVTVGPDGKLTGVVTTEEKTPTPPAPTSKQTAAWSESHKSKAAATPKPTPTPLPKGATDGAKIYNGVKSNTGGVAYRTAKPTATPKPATKDSWKTGNAQ